MKRDITQGMWVKDEEGRIGIAQLDDVFGKDGKPVLNERGMRVKEPTIHLVNDQGETTLVIFRAWTGLVQSTYQEIPERRREGLDRNYAANELGYV